MDERPDPDVLLARVNEAESRERRGRLTVFFGAAPGVGKTFAMLEAGRLEKESGRDVAIGVVETHGRYDTGALTLGHEVLPRKEIVHKGILLRELDLDAALARRPSLLLVDELAHENAPGSRHAKRWQDVDELLGAGVDVFTTLNVQHLQSLNDVVAQITQVVVRETVPDAFFERADDVRLLDLPIDELLDRLREGKVYAPGDAARAEKSFFQPGNLIALRELALRVTARRVDVDMRRYRTAHGIDRPWPVAERWLVAVSASPASEKLLRAARRLAAEAHAEWIAAYVETPASLRLSARDRERASEHLRLAAGLGGETATLAGTSGPEEIVRFARAQNVTRILVGKPTHAAWRDRLRTPFLDALVRDATGIDVHVIAVDGGDAKRDGGGEPGPAPRPASFVAGGAVIGTATLFSHLVFGRTAIADIAMVYVLGIVLVSLRWGFGPSMLAAVLAVLSFDYFFIPPYYTFAVADLTHVATFGVMFLVAAVISELTRRVRDQADAAREREARTAALFALTRTLTTAKSAREVVLAASEHLARVFDASVLFFVEKGGTLEETGRSTEDVAFTVDDKERAVAEWVFQNAQPAGMTTDTLPKAHALYLPIGGSPLAGASTLGVVGLAPRETRRLSRREARQHLDAFLGPIAGALERTRLAEKAQDALVRVEAEELKNALLSSVSHDLRTPLAVITGTASTLLDGGVGEEARVELTQGILSEAERLNRLVRNLLDMTRIDAGAVAVNKEWQPVEEAVGVALDRTRSVLGARKVTTEVGPDLAPYDSLLLQQVLINLLENAAKYTPDGSEVVVRTERREREIEIAVLDRGPGFAPGEESRVFEKFRRGKNVAAGGVGLGLTICKAIVAAHGGRIWAENRAGGGAALHFTLPLEGEPPRFEEPEPKGEAPEVRP